MCTSHYCDTFNVIIFSLSTILRDRKMIMIFASSTFVYIDSKHLSVAYVI